MSEKMEACPFCGGEGDMSFYARTSGPEPAGHFVECISCAAAGPGFDIQGDAPDRIEYTKAKAAEAWNTRLTPANGEQVEQAGWRLVPTELTQEMLDATCATDADDTAMRAAWSELLRTAPTFPTPTQDARERVKVLKEALSEAGRMQFAAANIPEGYIDGWADCVEHIRNAEVRAALVEARHEASTALGNQEERL